MLRMQRAQPLARDMRIDRRRRDVGVAQQHLHRAQIAAEFNVYKDVVAKQKLVLE